MQPNRMEPTLDIEHLKRWMGKEERACDVVDVGKARLMQTTLDREASFQTGDVLPPLWHWLSFPTETPMSRLGRDGHPALGGFLPPVALPRRMWAGGRLRWSGSIRLGDAIEKRSTIKDVAIKKGRSGTLCFVTVAHEFFTGGESRLTEEHDIVYREEPAPDAPKPTPAAAPKHATWSREIRPDPVFLFRYSALTFNGHRIHYDVDFCRDQEGYPGLVVHGPLIATLLADLAVTEAGKPLQSFDFRAKSPLFDTASFSINGDPADDGARLFARSADGALAMQAEARFAP